MDYLRKLSKSWTLWVNTALASIWALLEFGLPEIAASLPMIREYIPADMYGKLFLISAILNILLRFKTTTALRDK